MLLFLHSQSRTMLVPWDGKNRIKWIWKKSESRDVFILRFPRYELLVWWQPSLDGVCNSIHEVSGKKHHRSKKYYNRKNQTLTKYIQELSETQTCFYWPYANILSNIPYNKMSDFHPNLVISPSRKAHKLLFTKMRDASTSSEDFVKYSKRAMRLLAEDALGEFPATDATITTPCGWVFFVFLFHSFAAISVRRPYDVASSHFVFASIKLLGFHMVLPSSDTSMNIMRKYHFKTKTGPAMGAMAPNPLKFVLYRLFAAATPF